MSEQDDKLIDNRKKRTYAIDRQRANLLYSGMSGLALIVMQAFISVGLPDGASFISVLAFALVLPIVGVCLYIINDPVIDLYKIGKPFKTIVSMTLPIGCIFIFIGLVAALWHLSWIMGVISLISGVVATIMHL
jgi:hypothetical protein